MKTRASISLLLALALPTGAGAGGYLAMIGPAPLKFKASRPAPELPPLKMSDDMVDAAGVVLEYGPPAVPGVLVESANKAVNVSGGADPLLPEADDGFIGPLQQAAAPATIDKAILTPRAFIRYFTPPDTNSATSVILPLDFSPPSTAPRASSTATYEKK